MAKNVKYEDGDQLCLPVVADTVSGDLVQIGDQGLYGLALIDRNADGEATVKLKGVVTVQSSAAFDPGDKVYDHAGTINAMSSGGNFIGNAVNTKDATAGDLDVRLSN